MFCKPTLCTKLRIDLIIFFSLYSGAKNTDRAQVKITLRTNTKTTLPTDILTQTDITNQTWEHY